MFSFNFFQAISQNLLTNGSFESGTTNWTNLAGDEGVASYSVTSTDAIEGTNSLEVAVTTLGANPWSIQSIHSATNMITDLSYTFSFYAKGDVDGLQVNAVLQNNVYLAQSFTLTTTWEKYTWVFTAQEEAPQLRIQYPSLGTYHIDDVQILDENTTGDLTIEVSPKIAYQTMVGFGGAITWYCDLVTKSPHTNEVIDLMINDVGTDIVRLKNWYYPSDYPLTKSPLIMEEDYFKGHFDATNEIYDLVKQANPEVEVLLSSWSPPSAYKSNGALNEGTLKKKNGQFMYAELGQYYNDVLDNITFTPDYFSFQNEPGYVNAGWSTCEWRPTETEDFPGYDLGLDAVYNAIKERANVPKMLGPESENIGQAGWDNTLNSFASMADAIKDKSYLYGYGYHLYNYGNSPGNLSAGPLNMIRDNFGDKPNFMTEFSSGNFDWLQTADAIHQTVVEANASAYIYWELMWDTASTSTMMGFDGAGEYIINDHYYTMKHYAKHVDKGAKRIAITGGNNNVKLSGFLNATGDQITIVAINNSVNPQNILLKFSEGEVADIVGFQSVSDNFYQSLESVSSDQTLPAKSLTTYVVTLTDVITAFAEEKSPEKDIEAFPIPFSDTFTIQTAGAFDFEIYGLDGKIREKGRAQNNEKLGAKLDHGMYIIKVYQEGMVKTLKVTKN